jgi:hypothetical protein
VRELSNTTASKENAMRLLIRCGGALVLLLSTVGIGCCIAGVVGVWMFRQTASEKVLDTCTRFDVGLQRAAVANDNARRAQQNARADVAKGKGQGTFDDWQSELDNARSEVGRVKDEIPGWLTLAAIAVTVISVWGAVSQVSLFVHALRWCQCG